MTTYPETELILFSTRRQVREFAAEKRAALLPKLMTIGEFFGSIVVVEDAVFVDPFVRMFYLYEVARTLDLSALHIPQTFEAFLKNGSLLSGFFQELFAERVTIDALQSADTYADYEHHLQTLEALLLAYRKLLASEGLVDTFTIDDYRLNQAFLAQFSKVTLNLEGILSRFELEVLHRLPVPLEIVLPLSPFNRKIRERLHIESETADWGLCRLCRPGDTVVCEPNRDSGLGHVTVVAFSERMRQAAFVFYTIDGFIGKGLQPSDIAVILPDETFAAYLRLFDTNNNLNFSMGTPFAQSAYYLRLEALLQMSEAKKADEAALPLPEVWLQRWKEVKSFETFLAFLISLEATSQEKEMLEEPLYRFKCLESKLATFDAVQLLRYWLAWIEPLRLDDRRGGPVTVMGVLESRGATFCGVIIVDFNEGTVPSVTQHDLFLNSRVRESAGMPTRKDREDLQKHYYDGLLRRSRMAAISYVRNEVRDVSRFLLQLGLKEGRVEDEAYRRVLFEPTPPPERYDAPILAPNPFVRKRSLTPTRLKTFLQCARKYYYRYELQIEPEEETGVNTGLLIHAALYEAALAKVSLKSGEAYARFLIDFVNTRLESRSDALAFAVEWEARLRAFGALDFARLQTRTQHRLEAWLEPVIFEGFELGARIDRVDMDAGNLWLIDYKSSKKVDKLIDDAADFQLLFYALCAQAWPEAQTRQIVAGYYDLYNGEFRAVDMREQVSRLRGILRELEAPETIDFARTEEVAQCRYCAYRVACGREA